MTPAPEPPIAPTVRAFIGACAALGMWQTGWLADQANRIEPLLPAPWTITFWLDAWAVVAVTCAYATLTGRDRHARVGLIAIATVSGAGILTTMADGRPMGTQFWQVGQAAVILATSFALLAAPLRPAVEPEDLR